MQPGAIITNGVHLQAHEYHTVEILRQNGFSIELIPGSQIRGLHLPDIIINNIPWEIKAPEGNSKNTIRHNIQHAMHQSENIIIDLFRCRLNEEKAISEIKHHFTLSKRIKKIIIIKKDETIIDLYK